MSSQDSARRTRTLPSHGFPHSLDSLRAPRCEEIPGGSSSFSILTSGRAGPGRSIDNACSLPRLPLLSPPMPPQPPRRRRRWRFFFIGPLPCATSPPAGGRRRPRPCFSVILPGRRINTPPLMFLLIFSLSLGWAWTRIRSRMDGIAPPP